MILKHQRKWQIIGTIIGFLSLVNLAYGEESQQPNMAISSFKALGALLLVLALIVLAAWAAKKYLHFLPKLNADGHEIRVLSSRSLGAKRSVYLLEVEGKMFLIGSADGSVNLIREININEDEQGI
jgi:flagellar biosynthetic protein FliO